MSLLTQALETLRACRPGARLGRYAGAEKDLEADVLLASVQTLERVRHLRQFAPDTFDYIVVDEFHHAAACTYRALIDSFTPTFLLGLTATPDRMDGGDLLGLCQENLVFRCDAFEGIEAGLLSPVRYFGVPDEVDYSNIPWRGRQFDDFHQPACNQNGGAADISGARQPLSLNRSSCRRHHDVTLQPTGPRLSAQERSGRDDARVFPFARQPRQFDEQASTAAVATQARARNAFEQHQRMAGHAGARTLAFCVSQRHADFMSGWFNGEGLRTVAVHSGPTSAPRASSLERLAAGELDAVFAVDMFNEGVDVPSVDTVLMLRPTESTIVWIQQFGRGLRRAAGKDHLTVVDYIGNHRIFLTKARALLGCGEGERALRLQLEKVADHTLALPPGCEITYELEAMEMLRGLLRPAARGDAFEAWYLDFKERFGGRPTALDMFHAGFNPRASGHGRWFDFVRDQGDLTDEEARALAAAPDFLNVVATTQMSRSYKMLLLAAMRREGALPGRVGIDALTARFVALAARHPAYRGDVTAALDNVAAVRRLLEDNPIDAWVNGRGTGGRAYFSYADGVFGTTFQIPGDLREAFEGMVDEIIDWRLAEYLDRGGVSAADTPLAEVAEGGQAVFVRDEGSRAELWREYMREEIPGLYGLRFNTGSWNQGFVVQGQHAFLLVTLDKSNLQVGAQYLDHFTDPEHFSWHSQTRTARASKHGQIISGTAPAYAIHLFVRGNKIRGAKGAPFVYCGDVDFERWEGDAPISVVFRLRVAAPERLRRVFGV